MKISDSASDMSFNNQLALKPSVEIYNVQQAAALALLRLIGAEAIPIIEDELPRANWDMKTKLIMALQRLYTKQRLYWPEADAEEFRDIIRTNRCEPTIPQSDSSK